MSEAGKSLRVFISYARRDCSDFAQELLQGLEVAGFDAFLDKHDIAAGEDWEARLGGLIQSSDTVVFVVSPAAVASERCAWEVQRAETLSKRVIPVVAIPVTEEQTPASLKRLNYIFFSEGHSFTKGLSDLATALRVDLAWIREHTRLGELARRWQERDRSDVLLLRGAELDGARRWLAEWMAPAPEPTDVQRAFIAESEAAEGAVVKRERARQARLRWGLVAASLVFATLALTSAFMALRALDSARAEQAARKGLGETLDRLKESRAKEELAVLDAFRARDVATSALKDREKALADAEINAENARRAEEEASKAREATLRQLVRVRDLASERARSALASPASAETRRQAIEYATLAIAAANERGDAAYSDLLIRGRAHYERAGLYGARGMPEFDCAANSADVEELKRAEGDFVEAIRVARDANVQRPSEALGNLGCVYMATGRYVEAVRLLERARELAPNDTQVHSWLERARAERSSVP